MISLRARSIPFAIAAGLLLAGPAQAQFGGFNPMGVIGSGGRVNPNAAVNMGLGMLQQVDRQHRAEQARRQRALAAEEARRRRAALARTKAGRAQLAREDRAARKKAKQEEALMMGIIGAVGASIMGGGGGGGSGRRTEYYYEYGQPRGASSSPSPSTSGFYGNCHGGAFYGC